MIVAMIPVKGAFSIELNPPFVKEKLAEMV